MENLNGRKLVEEGDRSDGVSHADYLINIISLNTNQESSAHVLILVLHT